MYQTYVDETPFPLYLVVFLRSSASLGLIPAQSVAEDTLVCILEPEGE